MRPNDRSAGILIFLASMLLLLLLAPLGEGYQDVDVDTCGSAEIPPCHGVVSSDVAVTVDGPNVVMTGSTATYVITVTGGPSVTYGYFVVFVDPDGRSIDSFGNPLFHVEPNSITRVVETNNFVVEFTPPRYAVGLTMRVSAVSADNSLSPLGDSWNYTVKEVEVEYPVSSEFPGLGISFSTYLLGTSILAFGLLIWLLFFVIDRKVKKEVVYTGGEGKEGNE